MKKAPTRFATQLTRSQRPPTSMSDKEVVTKGWAISSSQVEGVVRWKEHE